MFLDFFLNGDSRQYNIEISSVRSFSPINKESVRLGQGQKYIFNKNGERMTLD